MEATKLGRKSSCCLPGCSHPGFLEFKAVGLPKTKRYVLCAKCPIEKGMDEIKEILSTLPSVKEDVVTGEAIDNLKKNLDDWEDGMF